MNKKSIVIIAGSIIGILILILVVLWIMSLVSHKYYSYEEVEAKMIKATESFYKSNPEILPVDDGRTTLSYNTLVENGFIKPLNELLEDGDSCTAEIGVIKNDNNYKYLPKLTCSDKYSTLELAEYIIKNSGVATEGSGLYSDGQGGYYFKGKVKNNYLEFAENLDPIADDDEKYLVWQIIGIDKDNGIRIRLLNASISTRYDNRYNELQESNTGYNDFEYSLMKEKLKDLETSETFLSEKDKALLTKSKLCIGPRRLDDTTKDGSTECAIQSKDEYLFGLLYPYEYMRASLDDNCKTMESLSCQNYNVLADDESVSYWTTIPVPGSNYEIYVFDGEIYSPAETNDDEELMITATISPYVIFKSGDGTIENPYKISY